LEAKPQIMKVKLELEVRKGNKELVDRLLEMTAKPV